MPFFSFIPLIPSPHYCGYLPLHTFSFCLHTTHTCIPAHAMRLHACHHSRSLRCLRIYTHFTIHTLHYHTTPHTTPPHTPPHHIHIPTTHKRREGVCVTLFSFQLMIHVVILSFWLIYILMCVQFIDSCQFNDSVMEWWSCLMGRD